MLATAARLAFATAALALVITSADAQQTHPECARAKDKVKCNCYFSNGAQIVYIPGSSQKRMGIWSHADAEGYHRCMRRNGRPNG